jgi:hypothetical protein
MIILAIVMVAVITTTTTMMMVLHINNISDIDFNLHFLNWYFLKSFLAWSREKQIVLHVRAYQHMYSSMNVFCRRCIITTSGLKFFYFYTSCMDIKYRFH